MPLKPNLNNNPCSGGMLPEDDSDDGDDVDDVDGPEINPGYTPKFVFKKDSRKSFVFQAKDNIILNDKRGLFRMPFC